MANTITSPRDRTYTGYGAGALLLLVAGFSQTFFFRPIFDVPPETLTAMLHGATLTSWFLLFLAQTTLAATGRVQWHRALGRAAIVVVIAGAATFVWMAFDLYQNRPIATVDPAIADRALLTRLVRELTVFAAFPVLAGLGLAYRRRREVHRRLMLLATISLLPPALSRFVAMAIGPEARILATLGLTAVCLLVPIVIELIRTRRLHPVLAFGAPLWFAYLVGTGLIVPIIMMR
jgi:hypothetical protein